MNHPSIRLRLLFLLLPRLALGLGLLVGLLLCLLHFPLGLATPEPGRVEVHDGPAQVGVERSVRAQVLEPPHAPDERFVRQILRLVSVARQEIREADPTGHVAGVELRHRAVVGFHQGPLIQRWALRNHRTPKTPGVGER